MPTKMVKSHENLAQIVAYMSGRRVTAEMLWTAAGISRSKYYNKQSEFFTPDHLVAIATEFGINVVWLLGYYEVISDVDVIEYAERELGMVRTTATAARAKQTKRTRGPGL